MPIRIAITDDKAINRQSLIEKLAEYKEVELVLTAKHGKDFLEQLKQTDLKPQVVLMDLEMPELDGIETIRLATASYPDIKFIVITVFEDIDKIFEAIKAGASGYMLKEESGINIIDGITLVHEHNGIPMSPSIARKAMDLLKNVPMQKPEVEDAAIDTKPDHAGLSSREMDVLKEIVSGKNYKAVGEKLFISPQTVRKHVSHIYEKLHVNSRAQVINIAHKKRWI
jgi:DNA-binding NarL/FixJ family response regulator